MIHAWVIQLVQYDSIEWNSWSKGEIDYPVDLSGGQLACLHLKHRCYPNIHSGDYQAMREIVHQTALLKGPVVLQSNETGEVIPEFTFTSGTRLGLKNSAGREVFFCGPGL